MGIKTQKDLDEFNDDSQSKRTILISNNKDKNEVIEEAYTNKDLPLHYLLKQKKVEVEIADLNDSKF